VSFTRKIIDGARSGWSSVMERIAADDTPLSHVEPAVLQAELEARTAARKASPAAPGQHPVARIAGASEQARRERARLAAERSGRIHGERDARAKAKQAAQDETFRRMKEEAARGGTSTGTGAGAAAGGRPGGGGGRRFPFGKAEDKVAEHYKTLNIAPGSDLAAVKTAYRGLMRKYHPDMHAGNPTKLKAATELSMRVTTAYNALQAYFAEKDKA
jgi:DnaJ-domain-containing protein 1